ncbi:hypothetical protein SS50377_23184 [Spironucleus salmonicida]|uniref:Uncharacterized protein n=1 Tax=Spironucleus salmonicida TaxID=348837 RepID=A0A9P8LVU5_9EUKA|nr:hypothetical protein SS50377_23184 [Spironucleus salmonicida]
MNGIENDLNSYRNNIFHQHEKESLQYTQRYQQVIFHKIAPIQSSPLKLIKTKLTPQNYGVKITDPMDLYLRDLMKEENQSKMQKYYQSEDVVYQEIKRQQYTLVQKNEPKDCVYQQSTESIKLHHSIMLKTNQKPFSQQSYNSTQYFRQTFDYMHFRFKPDQFMPTQTKFTYLQKLQKYKGSQ